MDYIQPWLDYFSANPQWAIVLIFLIAMGEALLIIGLFVPSTAVLVGAGILVGTGHLGFWEVFLATAIGAIIGDQFSYWAGRLFGERLKTLWPLNRYPQLVAKGEDFVRRHGGKSIAIGRFVPGVKAVVPGIVGMFGMNQAFFLFVNVTSGTFWAAAHVFPGMLIGQGLAFAGELSGRLVVVLLLLLVLIAVAGYAIRLLAAGVSPYLNRLLARVSAWARQKKGRSWQRFARAVSPDNPRSVLIVLFAAIIFACLTGLGNLAVRAMSNTAVSNMDISVFSLMREMRNAPADEIMIGLTMLGDGVVMAMLAVAIIAWLVWRKAYRAASAAALAIAAAKLFEILLKAGIQRARPVELAYTGADYFSFPSSHATMAAVVFGILAVLVSHAMGRWGRALVYGTCAAAVVAIAFSRLYLGAHWLSDVLAGLLFGTIVAAAFGVAIEAIPPRRIRPLALFGASMIVFILAGAAHVTTGFTRAEQAYVMPQQRILVPVTDWVASEWQRLPPRRIDLSGKPEEVFLAQYAGELEPLSRYLKSVGWAESPRWTWRASLPYLNPNATLTELAPRPALHEGLKAKLTMIRSPADAPEQREVIRAYKTDLATAEGEVQKPIYLVSLTREIRSNGFHLYAIPSQRSASDGDVTALRDVLGQAKGLNRLAQHERAGGIQDLIAAAP
jgi:undecaprenyl-diphosphatase